MKQPRRPARLLLATLLAATALASAGPGAAAPPKPTPTPASKAKRKATPVTGSAAADSPVSVSTIEPKERTRVGDLVTLRGSGLDQVTAILLGINVAAEITEKSGDRIVFRVPALPGHPEGYRLDVELVIPKRPLLHTLLPIEAGPDSPALAPAAGAAAAAAARSGPAPASEGALLNETFSITADKPARFEVETGGALVLLITASSSQEVEIKIDPAGMPGTSLFRGTYGGTLEWPANLKEMVPAGPARVPPKRVVLTVATDSKTPATGRVTVKSPGSAGGVSLPVPK